ncbi:MerR family DNA-binding transcriptional regulator [Oscillatoria sp. CS-180]|nr:MerR family DNA-binding transcriptional regulator [Oscillatoria sp. CS-180]
MLDALVLTLPFKQSHPIDVIDLGCILQTAIHNPLKTGAEATMDLMKIGDLAKQTGLSIRTLHDDDEIRLLSSSHRTEAGHRLYDSRDIMRLQQILSLR